MIDIPGYEGRYAVTSCGKVWSYRHKRFMKQFLSNSGYYRVRLYDKELNSKSVSVHRIVAIAYLDNPFNLKEVNHKDENKQNNNINNLEWCTREYNNNYNNIRNKAAEKRGRKVICAETLEVFRSINSASDLTGIYQLGIRMCCELKYKSTHGFHFFYYDYFIEHEKEIRNSLKRKLIYCDQTKDYYTSVREISMICGVDKSCVYDVLNGKSKHAKGYTFKYVERMVIE